MNVRLMVIVLVAAVAIQPTAQEKSSGSKRGELKSLRDKASYSFGMAMASGFKKQSVDIDFDLLIQGVRDVANGGKLQLTEEQAQEVMRTFEQELIAKQAEESKRFLTDNRKRPGVKSTASGLQYKVLKAGKGPGPRPMTW